MLGVTLFGVFLTPVFYVVIENLADRLAPRPKPVVAQQLPAAVEGH
jgi:hypothetical protein